MAYDPSVIEPRWQQYWDEQQTIATLTGFVLGSLLMIWPWKIEEHMTDVAGNTLMKDGEPVIAGYTWELPQACDSKTLFVLVIMGIGIASICITEYVASKGEKHSH